MNNRIFILVLILVFTVGCAGPTMQIKKSENDKLRPMGLFICSSTQGLDDKDTVHRQFIIDIATNVLSNILNEEYKILSLNGKIEHNEVFEKSSVSFKIDENKIAKIAKQEGCASCLIVYYAVTELQSPNTINASILTPSGVFIPLAIPQIGPSFDEHALKGGENGMTLHMRCSLYGWLVSSDNASVLSKSHIRLAPFNKHIRDDNNKEQLYEDYIEYLSSITKDMFMPMIN